MLALSYSRACGAPIAGAQPVVWSRLMPCTKEVCAVILLEQLKEGGALNRVLCTHIRDHP